MSPIYIYITKHQYNRSRYEIWLIEHESKGANDGIWFMSNRGEVLFIHLRSVSTTMEEWGKKEQI